MFKKKFIIKLGYILFYRSYTTMSFIPLNDVYYRIIFFYWVTKKTWIRILRLLTKFSKAVLNISATFLLREIISSFWIIDISLGLLEILFTRKGFTVFQKNLLSVMFLVSTFTKKTFFSFRKD